MFDLIRRTTFAILLLPFLIGAAAAQDAEPQQAAVSTLVSEQVSALARLTARTDAVANTIAANAEDDAKLVDARLELEDILRETLAAGVAFRPRLSEINARLQELGPAPATGAEAAESELVSNERKALTAEKAEINVTLGKAEDLSVRVNGLINKIANLRRDLFTNLLTKRYSIRDMLSSQVVTDILNEGESFRQRVGASLRFAFRFKSQSLMLATVLAFGAAFIASFLGRRLFGRMVRRDPAVEQPSYISRLSVAFWSTLLPSVALIVFLALVSGLYQSYGVLNQDMAAYLDGLIGVIVIAFLVNRLSRSILSPDMPKWRLIAIEPAPARIIIWLVTALGLVVGLDGFAAIISDRLNSPLSTTIIKSLVAAVISGLLIVSVGQVKPFVDETGKSRPWPLWFRLVLFLLGFGSIIAAMAGFISLAQFISQQIVLTGTLVTTAYIGLLASRAISDEGGFAETAAGQWMKTDKGVDDAKLDQYGVLSSVIINVLLALLFVPLVLFQLRFQPGDIAAWLTKAANGFQIGTFSFSPLAILTGIGVFALGYFLTRYFQRWLDGTVMARGRVDPGVRNSIRTVVGYTGLAIAALISISAAGLDLSNLALVAGGLSLGIGFGLQNIVSNFVSGLILLAERPFKVGDWVEAGAISGTVRKISVRATEIETFQRQTVILPNSILINGAVGNWTHRNKLGRIEVPVNVVYASDPHKVRNALMDLTKAHPLVLRNPEPAVLFQGFSDTAMQFEVRAFVADVGTGGQVRNDLRFAVVDAFRREGIELAYTLRPPVAVVVEEKQQSGPVDAPPAEAKTNARPPRRRG